MSAHEEARLLVSEIRRSLAVLDRIECFYDKHAAPDESQAKRTTTRAIVVAETLVNYYTCLETVFHRISQYFENHLSSDRWHTDLLDRMVISIPGTRPSVISEATRRARGCRDRDRRVAHRLPVQFAAPVLQIHHIEAI